MLLQIQTANDHISSRVQSEWENSKTDYKGEEKPKET